MSRFEAAVGTLEGLLEDDVWRAANPRLGDATFHAVAILKEALRTQAAIQALCVPPPPLPTMSEVIPDENLLAREADSQ